MGAFEVGVSALMEATVKYHSVHVCGLTSVPVNPGEGPWQPGSLTGAVSSKRVTEECKGWLSTDGNRVRRARAQASFTVRSTDRTVAKAGPSDPAIPCGRVVAHRIKGTPGITG